MKPALITGVTGQDGAYLAALLLGKGVASTCAPISTAAQFAPTNWLESTQAIWGISSR
jgi:GDP-D-mannose dehydratase